MNTFTYNQERFGSGRISNGNIGHQMNANSGAFLSGVFGNQSTPNYGQTPIGHYEANNCRVGTGNIYRCDLTPIGHNALGRTHLQIHEKSTSGVKSFFNADSKGCIATPMAAQVRNGDRVVVKR